ncbi:fatty acid synthase isoform X2 [Anabrus simplex]|uniref:fatty acid synthase isoform X2 n=1 Tax=Anabrus simplex TaxID=316456 RepID=UPI0035A2D304
MAPQNSDGACVNGPKPYLPKLEPGEEVVISGMACRLPLSDNMKELWENLVNKVDMVTDNLDRWNNVTLGAPSRFGKINNLDLFDQPFFHVGVNQVQNMDPMVRILHEVAYEAIVDAGFNPRYFQNRCVAVFTGVSFGESEMRMCFDKADVNGLVLTGTSRAMYANRISYSLNLRGPSYMLDSGHASGTTALEQAYRAVRDGRCEAAIVAAANLCLAPNLMLQFMRRGVLSADGVPRPFDEDANGIVRSEAVTVLFVQKARDAKRVYATVVHAKSTFEGDKDTEMLVPSHDLQMKMLGEFYDECGVDPKSVDFIEANANGLKIQDDCELNVIDSFFCKGRKSPLPIGSIKSNMGTPEAAAGLCGTVKALLCFEAGQLAPNINYSTPSKGSQAISSGRIQVVTEPTPFNGELIAINSFSLNGCLSHVLLRRWNKDKINNGLPLDTIPRLLIMSGRAEEAVRSCLEEIQDQPIDVEGVRLLSDIHGVDTPGYLYRGYTLLEPETKAAVDVKYFTGTRRPLWFVYSGMGSQWAGMGKSLLQIPLFASAIKLCDDILKPKGLDIYHIITADDPTLWDNVLNCFVGIAAIQIGLTDILHALGIVPDGIIGHSVGELGCAYADGTFTAEQVILAAYYRGLCSLETKLIPGAMAAVGLGYSQIKDLCPPEVEVACHNSHNSSTISGPKQELSEFVKKLVEKKIFAKEVASGHIAYHSRYIAHAGPALLKYLKPVIPNPKPRSEKWISSSVPEAEWDTPAAKLSSAEYHVNNLLKPVLFEEASRHVHNNALTIEIAPHGLLQAILKRCLHQDAVNISLTQRGKDGTQVLLSALGKLYENGLEMDLSKIYPPVEYPVSRGTFMTAPLVKWDHSEKWYVALYQDEETKGSGERAIPISIKDDEYKVFAGNNIDGQYLLPFSACLVFAWETAVMISPSQSTQLYQDVSISFENVRFYRPVFLPLQDEIELVVMVQKGSGNFEVSDSNIIIASGRVYIPEDVSKESLPLSPPETQDGQLTSKDIYKRFKMRGYNYSGEFCSLVTSDLNGTYAQIKTNKNWILQLEGLIQAKLLGDQREDLRLPSAIQKLTINIPKHNEDTQNSKVLPVHVHKGINFIESGGIQIRGLKMHSLARQKPSSKLLLEKYKFIPHFVTQSPLSDLQDLLRVCVQIMVQNQGSKSLRGIELLDKGDGSQAELLAPHLVSIINDTPFTQINFTVLMDVNETRVFNLNESINVANHRLSSEKNCNLVVGTNLLSDLKLLQNSVDALAPGGVILSKEKPAGVSTSGTTRLNLQVLLDQMVGNHRIVLLNKGTQAADLTVIRVTEKNCTWLPSLKSALLETKPPARVVLLAQGEPFNGILGMFNCVRKEPGGEVVRCFLIQDPKAPAFDPGLALYRTQLDKDLAVNVLQDGKWGGYYHLSLSIQPTIVPHYYNASAELGNLNSLTWFEGPLDPVSVENSSSDRKLVHVSWSALNLQDVLLATGRIAPEIMQDVDDDQCLQGIEFSGRTSDGRRVMGIVPGGAISNLVDADTNLLWDVPSDWTLEEAATVPVAYATAIHALIAIGEMKKGESILIHAAAGSVGQAAINLALHHGVTVFATVGSQEKKDFLLHRFPQLKESHIGNSRDTSFEQMVLEETNGNGVDIVLNSLTGRKLQMSINCLALGGRFLELGMFDLVNHSQLGLEIFLKQTSFKSISLRSILTASKETKQDFHKLVKTVLQKGAVKPLQRTVFDNSEVDKAYSYMTTGKHIGKVLIRIRSDESQRVTILAHPRFYCNPEHSYVIVGNLEGYGLELANWLVSRGARHLVLTSQNGITSGFQHQRIHLWKIRGVTVHISTVDVSSAEGVKALLAEAKSVAPLSAIFHIGDAGPNTATQEHLLAMPLRRLDAASRQLCPDLKHFVAFSSSASGRGEVRQTARAMAGSAAERVCEARAKDGLPALAIQLPTIAELQDGSQLDDVLVQGLPSSLEAVDSFLKQPNPLVSSILVPKKQIVEISPAPFMELTAKLLGFKDAKTLATHPNTQLLDLGLDSMTVEVIREQLKEQLGLYMSATDVSELTVSRLQMLVELNIQRRTGTAEELEHLRLLLPTIPEEQNSYPSLVKLPSAGNSGSPVFLLPGLVSVAKLLEPLASKFSRPSYALQLANHIPGVTIQDLVGFLLPHVQSQLPADTPFMLVGHSFGGLLALEMAAVLEAEGQKGRVVLLDSTPNLIVQLCGGSEEGLDRMQIWLVFHLLSLLGVQETQKLNRVRRELNKMYWAERTEQLLEHAPPDTHHSRAYLKAFADATDALIKCTMPYRWEHPTKLASPVLLLRPTVPSLPGLVDNLLNDCCQQKVEISTVEGNHASIIENPETARIINEFLNL